MTGMEKSRDPEEHNQKQLETRQNIIIYIIGITLFFALYEFLKTNLMPDITVLESHAISICVVSILNTIFFIWFRKVYSQQTIATKIINQDLLKEITEHKLAEEALQESRSRLIAAQAMAHVGNWELNLEANRIWASEEVFNIYGFERNSPHLPLDLVQKSVLSEYRESLDSALIGLVNKKGKYDEEFKIINAKTGEAHFLHSKAILLLDKTGNASKVVGTIQDITERKQAEDELQSNRRQLTDIIEFLPDATLAINMAGQVIIWNKAIAEMTRIPAAEMIGKSDNACTIPFYGKARSHLMDLVFLDNEEITSRYPKLTREGDTLMVEVFCPALYDNKGAWVFAKASPLHDQSGNIIGAIESIRYITEQKLAEAVLQAKTVFLEAQTNASLDGILVVNQKQTRILTNRRISELFNVPQNIIDDEDDTLLLRHIVSLTKDPEQFLERVIYLDDHIDETSCDEIEFKSGMVLDRQSAPVRDKDGKYYGRIWTFHDITEHKRLEAVLEKEKNLLETTLISVGDGVISTDNKGNIVFLNRVAEFLTGWTQEAAKGQSIEEVFHIVDEFTRERCENIVKKAFESGKVTESANHTILISKDGIERPIEDSAAPIVQENGETFGVVLVFRDFSERKQKLKEIEFLSYHDQLTGLYNRRFYEEELKRLDKERNFPLTIVMADVNALKLINDSFGHVMGDELLKIVAAVMTKGCRSDDIIARLGGDEFVILLPQTDAHDAEQIIKRIKDLASKEKVGPVDISVSFGYETKHKAEEKIQEIFKKAEDHMYKKKLFESPSMRGKTVKAIIYTLHEKNKRDEQHSHRVSFLCESMGKALSLPEGEIEELKTFGLLHDIGKIAIDDSILNKAGRLTEDEWEKIKSHPEIGYRILSTVNEMSEMAEYVLFHHEKWDGSGYPKGLKGEAIPLQSRIISLADAYDAITSERSYRSAQSEAYAIKELQKNAGLQFDPKLVRVFVEKVLDKPSA